MAFTNSTNSNPKKSITGLIREAISQSLSEEDAALYVSRKISTKRISKRRLMEIYRELISGTTAPASRGHNQR